MSNLFDFYNNLADSYDAMYANEQFRKYSVIKDYVGGKVLDIGCGTGLFLDFFCSLNKDKDGVVKPKLTYVGLDYSNNLLNIAQKRSLELTNNKCSGLIDTIKFYLVDASKFDYLSLSEFGFEVDTVVAFTSLHNMSDVTFLKTLTFDANYIFGILKRSKNFSDIRQFIFNYFDVLKTFDDPHDLIIIAKLK